jgi:hypothetical protein
VKASSLILSVCAVLVGLSGCSTPCEGVCASYNSCTIKQRVYEIDCATYCDREQQFEKTAAKARANTCKKEFDAHISCWQTNIKNICDAENTKCEASATAWTDCVAKFCNDPANADDQACVRQNVDGGPPAVPALSGF